MPKLNLRVFISLLLSLAFLVVLVSGLVLWLAHSPQTFGVGRDVWKHAHIYISLLMAAAVVLHFWLNWSAYWNYLWEGTSRRLGQKWELGLAVALVAAVAYAASLAGQGDMLRRIGAMSLQQVAERSGQSVDQIVSALKKEGIDVHDPADSLGEIAEHNKLAPQAVWAVVERQVPLGGAKPSRK